MVVLFAELSLYGLANHVGAEGTGPATPSKLPGPRTVLGGGPVIRIGPHGEVVTRAMDSRTIALTFDDGPDPQWTPEILDVLRRHHARATFFVIGSRVNEYPDLARRIVDSGSELGVH